MDRKRQTEAKLDQEKRGRQRMERGLYVKDRSLIEYSALSPVCLLGYTPSNTTVVFNSA